MLRQAKYMPVEFAYQCPYCGFVQGYTEEICDRDLGFRTCSKCKKQFLVTNEADRPERIKPVRMAVDRNGHLVIFPDEKDLTKMVKL